MSLFPDSPLRVHSAVRRSGKTEWFVTESATGRCYLATYDEATAREYVEAWESGIDAEVDGVVGKLIAGVFVPQGGADESLP